MAARAIKNKKVQFRITEKEFNTLGRVSNRMDLTMSEMFRKIIRRLEQKEQEITKNSSSSSSQNYAAKPRD